MDIKCSNCLEDWDLDSLHDAIAIDYDSTNYTPAEYATLYSNARKAFSRLGCAFMEYGNAATTKNCEPAERGARTIVSEVYDLLGDDMDGAAAMLEDADMMRLFD